MKKLENLNINKRIPSSLRGTVFEGFVNAFAEELLEFRNKIREFDDKFFNIDLLSPNELSELNDLFGIPFYTLVRSEISFLREETRSASFKIMQKGTSSLYKSFIVALDRIGEVFIYIYRTDIDNIVRSMRNPFSSANTTHNGLPFRHESLNDFSGRIEDFRRLDENEPRILDSFNSMWSLDVRSSEISTNHIGLEYFIDRVINRNGKHFLMTNDYFKFVELNLNHTRRVKEVPHIGAQLSIQISTSGLSNSPDFIYSKCKNGEDEELCEKCTYKTSHLSIANNNSPESICYKKIGKILTDYTIPSLELKAVACPDFFDKVKSYDDLFFAEFGIGVLEVASTQNPSVPFPKTLNKRIFSSLFSINNLYESSNYVGGTAEYLGQSLNNFEINLDSNTGMFDGENQNFEFFLDFIPIQRNNVTLTILLPTGESLLITDNGRGEFLSKNGKGNINYDTGECTLTTKFDYLKEEIISLEDNFLLNNNYFEYFLENEEKILAGSVWLLFTTQEEDGSIVTHVVNDTSLNDDIGIFSHPLIDSTANKIYYITGKLEIRFLKSLANFFQNEVLCRYYLPVNRKYPENTRLEASYFFTQNTINITEVGFKNKNNEMVCYATFPPIEFGSSAYHLNFTILVKKPEPAIIPFPAPAPAKHPPLF